MEGIQQGDQVMIILYGALRKKFGKTIASKVHSVEELLRAADANRSGFRASLDKDRHYVIRRGDTFKTGKDVNDKELEMSFKEDTWHVLPLPMGHGGNGIFQTVLGAVLTVVGVVTQQYWLVGIGVSMMLGGISAMLAPSPDVTNYETREAPDKRASFLFNGPTNRTEPGAGVPIIYGKDVFVGSIFVSGGLEIGDLN